MIATTQLRLVLVTPETTLLDQPVRSVVFPLFDGQMGVLPGRAPMVGRMGTGELKFEGTDGSSKRYFVDGGFVQVKGSIVSILTDRAQPAANIDAAAAEQELLTASQRKAHGEDELAARERAVNRARRRIALSRRRGM